jgi:hypothetical protein
MRGLTNYNKVVKNATPNIFRVSVFLDYIYSIIQGGLKKVNDNFDTLTKIGNDRIIFNCQNIYLTKFLNDNFLIEGARPFYTDQLTNDKYYLYNYDEVDADPIYLYNRTENQENTYLFLRTIGGNFIIYWATELTGFINIEEIKKNIDNFNLFAVKYSLIEY